MNILVLDSTAKSITSILGASSALVNYTVSYGDSTATGMTEGVQLAVSNGTNVVAICNAPGDALTKRLIRNITVYNGDTVTHTVTVSLLVTATNYIIIKQIIQAGKSWSFGEGVNVLPSSATAAEVATGTDDAKYVTSKAIKDSVNVPNVAPSTSGNVLTSNGTAWTSAVGSWHGQCYLSKSSTNLLLSPYNGNKLIINTAVCTIPDAGVTLAPPAVASTTYYIYAYMSGATMTLIQDATAPVIQAGTGVMIKTGDATRTLVGMARTTSGNAWADSAPQMFVISYFNRKNKAGKSSFTANRTTASATYVELNTEIRIEFLAWGDEANDFFLGGFGTNGATNGWNQTSFGIDGTTAVDTVCAAQAYGAGAYITHNLAYTAVVSEGYHYVTVLGLASGGAGTWFAVTSQTLHLIG